MSQPETLGDARGVIERMAIQLARNNQLLVDGVIWCWHCGAKPALMPSLACAHCLAGVYGRKGIVAPECVNRHQTPEDVAAVAA